MDRRIVKTLTKTRQEEQDRRYVAMCAVDFRPFSMFDTPAFRWCLGGFSPAYIQKPILFAFRSGLVVDIALFSFWATN